MNEDSIYVVQAEKVMHGDTVYYRLPSRDLRILYDEAFGNIMTADAARDQLVLTFTYVPLVVIFLIMVTAVNIRWNNAYKRLKRVQGRVEEISEETTRYLHTLDLQKYHLIDRLFYFFVVWAMAALFDSLMILTGIFELPYAAVAATVYSIGRVITRLVGGSALRGVNDTDLINGFNEYVKKMVVKTFTDKIKSIINIKEPKT